MEKEITVSEREIVMTNKDILFDGDPTSSMLIGPAAIFAFCAVTGIPDYVLLAIPATVIGPLGMVGIQALKTKLYKNRVRRYLGMKEKPRLPRDEVQFFEKRDDVLSKMDSLDEAISGEVYKVTSRGLEKIQLKHNSMAIWDVAFKDLKSVYSLKGKKALTKVA